MYTTPPKYWPDFIRDKYFAKSSEQPEGLKRFAVLRNPYDRAVSEFIQQAQGLPDPLGRQTRTTISAREGNSDREQEKYERIYRTCDVNGYLEAELAKYRAGDRFRDNCHLL